MKKLRAADLFCGAGGFTTGAVASGCVDVKLAVNHWRPAIYTHQNNHPEVRHICARIDDIDPRHDTTLPELDLLMASPECTHHSIARGGRPIDDQKRATPWHVCVWAEAKRPKWIVIENVREFRDWGPLDAKCRPLKSRKGEIFRQWIRALEAIGYQVDHQLLNAADFGAATKRVRLFIVARLKRSRKDIPWPEPTHAGRWKPAYEVIDWSRPCPSIFSRKRPLAEKTLRRIEIGLRKFVGPFVATFRNHQDAGGISDPLTTICTSGAHHGLCVPFQLKAMGRCPGLTKGIDQPIPTTEPLDTISTHDRFGLAMASLIQTMREQVIDIGFRMLDVDELARAQGFPEGYTLFGTKAEQVKQVGNAVCPPVAEAICRAIGGVAA